MKKCQVFQIVEKYGPTDCPYDGPDEHFGTVILSFPGRTGFKEEVLVEDRDSVSVKYFEEPEIRVHVAVCPIHLTQVFERYGKGLEHPCVRIHEIVFPRHTKT